MLTNLFKEGAKMRVRILFRQKPSNVTDDEWKNLKDDEKRYLKAYPFLNEPVALDMLREALEIINVRIPRVKQQLYDTNTSPDKFVQLNKVLDALQRTLALYFARLGITYQSKQRRKEPKKFRTPLQLIEEEKEGIT